MTDFPTPAPSPAQSPFERIRQVDSDGQEFWPARDLMPVLEYTNWRNFKVALVKAQKACENSGYALSDHFDGTIKMVSLGSDSKREIHLSRYACYLVVQNADPNKEVVEMDNRWSVVERGQRNIS